MGVGRTVVVLAGNADGCAAVAALAPHFHVLRPLVPDGVGGGARALASWLTGVLDGIGLTAVAAVVAAEPFAEAAVALAHGDDGRVERVLIVRPRRRENRARAKAASASAACAQAASADDDVARRIAHLLAACGLHPAPP